MVPELVLTTCNYIEISELLVPSCRYLGGGPGFPGSRVSCN